MDINGIDENNVNVALFRLCESDPDLGLKVIADSGRKDPTIESEPIYRFCKTRAYQVKGTLWLKDIPWVNAGTAGPEELRLYVNNEDLNCLELSLSENRHVENDDPSILEIFGEQWQDQIDAISCILERCRPGRVQQICGKTELNYFGVERIKILPYLKEELPPEKLRPFLDIPISHPAIIKSTLIITTDTDSAGRRRINCMLFGKTFDDFEPDETYGDAQIGDVTLLDDRTFIASRKCVKCQSLVPMDALYCTQCGAKQ